MTNASSQPTSARCPICKAQTQPGFKPFCSKRCADIDLGKWFSNAYAIPGTASDDEAETPSKPAIIDDGDEP
jgi:uncharacterized protein